MTDAEEQKEREEIGAYQRVEQFLADPAVKAAITKLRDGYYDEFRASKTSADRDYVHAKITVLDEFAGEMIRTIKVGEMSKVQRERREEREKFRKPTR